MSKFIKECFFSILLLVPTIIFTQTVRVVADPASASLSVDSYGPTKRATVKTNEKESGVVAFLDGYTTQGVEARELLNKGETDYVIKLTKIEKLSKSYTSYKIELNKLVDQTGKLIVETLGRGMPTRVLPPVNINTIKFQSAVKTTMLNAGFNMVGNNVFTGKSDVPELSIGGEIIWLNKTSKLRMYTLSFLVHWSVFDIDKQTLLYETTTGGYGHSSNDFEEVVMYTIQDALSGLIYNKKFQDIVSKNDEKENARLKTIILQKPTLKKFDNVDVLAKEASMSLVTVKTETGLGTGFTISDNGYILTNCHVIKGAKKIQIVLENGFTVEASLINSNEEKDVALLKISGKGFKPLTLNTAENLSSAGTNVLVVGVGDSIKTELVTIKCIVNGKKESANGTFLQINTTIAAGNNGGPLISIDTGEVIGIITTPFDGKGTEGLAFAIPIIEAIKAFGIKFD